MKIQKNYSWIAIFAYLLFYSISTVNAKDIFVSDKGSDTNTGVSSGQAYKTLAKALGNASNGDIIKISGMIDLSAEPANINELINNLSKLTFEGADFNKDGFTGKNSRTLNLTSEIGSYTFKNLLFKEGTANASKGSLLYAEQTTLDFNNCKFTSTKSIQSNGAVYLGNKVTATFDDCEFSELESANGGACYIENAFNVMYTNTLFISCAAQREGGALYLTENTSISTNETDVSIRNSLFTGNVAQNSNGGAIYWTNSADGNNMHMSIVNSTFWKNGVAKRMNGGAICLYRGKEGSTFELINCTLTENYTSAGDKYGAGIYLNNSMRNMEKKILNCIIENNRATATSGKSSDLVLSYNWGGDEELMMYNNFIGSALHGAGGKLTLPSANKNLANYDLGLFAGLPDAAESYINSQHSIPLNDYSPALRHGNAEYLKELSIDTDQQGNKRMFIDNKCAAGAVEKTVETSPAGNTHVYEHFIISGQSLSTGDQSYPVISDENVEGNYMIGNQVWINYDNQRKGELNPLVGTIAPYSGNMTRESGFRAEMPLIGAVNHIQQKKQDGKRILATSCGYSGSSIEELSQETYTRDFYNDFLYTLLYGAEIARNTDSRISCPVLFWMQGEFNYDPNPDKGLYPGVPNTTTKEGYKALLLQMKNNMQTAVIDYYGQSRKPAFITYQTGAQYMRDTLSISMAQLEASNENKDIICAGPIYQVTDRGGHLDANGYRWYGEMLAKVYYKTQILREDFKPLQPKEISRGSEPNQIVIKYHVPKPPLVLDTYTLPKIKDYGFEIYLNRQSEGTRQFITDVSLVEDDTVVITCASSLNGVVIVTYAGSKVEIETKQPGKNNLNSHGNLRDSDDYEAFYNYIDLDKKNEDGTFFYPRETHETTLRPDYEPMDEDGNVIYDKPYPLYNFSVGYYYKLGADEDKLIIPGAEPDPTHISSEEYPEEDLSINYYGNTIYIKSAVAGKVDTSVYSIDGCLIKQMEDVFSVDEEKGYFLSGLRSGLYLVRTTVKGISCLAKILIP